MWGSFVGRADMYMKDGLHLSGKGAAVFVDGLTAAVDSGMTGADLGLFAGGSQSVIVICHSSYEPGGGTCVVLLT